MDSNSHRNGKYSYILIFSSFLFLTYLSLFLLRDIDDNRLTSWQMVFNDVNPAIFFAIIGCSILFAIISSKNVFMERCPVIFLFSASYGIAALFWGEPEVIVDASRYFTYAKHLETYGIGYFLREWGKEIAVWTDLPVVPFLYGLLFKVFGESRIYIQLFTTFLFSMTVVLTYFIGKTLWNEDIGFYAGLLFLGIPYIYTQVPLMLVDVPTMFFFTLAIFALITALEQGGIWLIIAPLSIFAAFFSKYSTWLMLTVLIVIFLGYKSSKYSYRIFITALVSSLLISVMLLYKYEVFSEQIKLLITFQKPGLRQWSENFISTFFFQTHPFITIAALYSVYAGFKKRDLRYAIIAWGVFLMFLFQIKRIRYIIMVFPMVSLMASYGLAQIKNKEITRFISLSIMTVAVATAVFVYLPFIKKISAVNLKDAGEFLDSLNTPAVEVFTVLLSEPVANPAVAVPIFDLFTEKKIHYQYDSGMPEDGELLRKSALRFTWEYKNPKYYLNGRTASDSSLPVVIISNVIVKELPYYIKQKIAGHSRHKDFYTADDIYNYATFVTIYH